MHVSSSKPIDYSYENFKCKAFYTVISTALIAIGIAGILWAIVTDGQTPFIAWKFSLILAPALLLTFLGGYVFLAKSVKYGDNVAINRYSGSSWSSYQSQRDSDRFSKQSKDYHSSSDRGKKATDNAYKNSSSSASSASSSEEDSDDIRNSQMYRKFERWYPDEDNPDELSRNQVITRVALMSNTSGWPWGNVKETYTASKPILDKLYQYKIDPDKYHAEIHKFNQDVEKKKYEGNDCIIF